MNRIIKKIKAKAGESLVETLAAILIAALSSAALAMGIMTATRSETKINAFQSQIEAQVSAAERGAGTETGSILLYMCDTNGDKIKLFKDDGTPLTDGNGVQVYYEQSYSVSITGGDNEITSFKLSTVGSGD